MKIDSTANANINKRIDITEKEISQDKAKFVGMVHGFLGTIEIRPAKWKNFLFEHDLWRMSGVLIVAEKSRLKFLLYDKLSKKITKEYCIPFEQISKLKKLSQNYRYRYAIRFEFEQNIFQLAFSRKISPLDSKTQADYDNLCNYFEEILFPKHGSHFYSIGYPINSISNLVPQTVKSFEQSKLIKTDSIDYRLFRDKSGAELYFELGKTGKINYIHPHFDGETTMSVALVKEVRRSSLDHQVAVVAWQEPENINEPSSGLYPFVFDAVDYFKLKKFDLPVMAKVHITAFAHSFTLFKSVAEYDKSQKDKPGFASKYFIPSGMFTLKKEIINPPRSTVIFGGVIKKGESLVNQITGQKFFHLVVETYGGEIDVVVDPFLTKSCPKPGEVISGEFELSGQIEKIIHL